MTPRRPLVAILPCASRVAAILFLAAARCLAAAAGEPAPPSGQQNAPPPAQEERIVVQPDQIDIEPWRLPPDYRKPDGSFDQGRIVERQKTRLPVLNERLRARLRLVETDHYLLFTDADAPTAEKFAAWSEALYSNLGRQFGISADERVWDGKCILMLFAARALFQSHACAFDGYDAVGVRDAGAYFAHESRPADDPQLVHICIPLQGQDERRLRQLFAHEATHAFFQLYRCSVALPLWLHEGLAEFMTVVNDPSLRAEKCRSAAEIARTGRSIRDILCPTPDGGFDYSAYSVSYTLVEFLLKEGRPEFKKFILGLKAGASQEDALRNAYGFGLAELERRWVIYAKEYLPHAD